MVGTTVSHFKIERELGKGGMGVVYLASDTELNRPVALKFLGLESNVDTVFLERFQREARAAAALNHPNIVTIYEFGESGGQRYIAMEYVEGESLRTKIAGGEIPVEEACRIARQMCDGLEAAHAQGIVHRDIKPENVMVMGDGRVKVLDFGIAKLRGARPITREATVGTAWYMSPEQLRGEQVDHRTDVWAAGIVLYEMLTGQPPFRGEYDSAVTYGIVNDDPAPIRDLRSDVPIEVADAVHRALEKDPEKRFGRIADFAAALGPAPTATALSVRPDSRFRSRLAWIAGAAVVVLAVAVAAITLLRQSQGDEYPLAGARPQQVTYNGDVGDFDLSPDGGFLAFVAPTADGQQALIVRDLGGSSVVSIDTGMTIASPVWSPDGAMIAAAVIRNDSTAGVYLIPRLGGPERRIFPAFIPLLSWSADGAQIALAAYGSYRVGVLTVATGESVSVTIPAEVGAVTSLNPRFTSSEIAVSAVEPQGTSIWKLSLAGDRPVRFFHEPTSGGYFVMSPQFVPAVDRLFFLRRHTTSQTATLLAFRIGRGDVPVGEPVELSDPPPTISGFRLTFDARTLVYRNDLSYSNLWLTAREGSRWESRQITEGTNRKSRGRFSPDGSSIVFTMADGPGYNLYTVRFPAATGAGSGGLQRLTSFSAATWSPAWSPDGKQVVFASDQGSGFHLWTVDRNGGTQRKLESALALPGSDAVIWAPSPLIMFPSQPHGEYRSVDPVSGLVAPAPGSDPGVVFTHPVWSPDGKRLAGLRLSRSTGVTQLSVFDDGRWRVLPMSEGSGPIGWTPDGTQVLVLAPRTALVSAIRVTDGRTTAYAQLPFRDPDPRMVDVNRYATAFLYAKREPVRDLWMLRAGEDSE
ncbi:MAG: Serine/threonine protein kinase [Bacteroidetes bacterium]|nr:Serine/threonine protein kinase [Bacteroidota bacterium]